MGNKGNEPMYYLEQIRQLMFAVLTPESLAIFCYDKLPRFYATLPPDLPWPEVIERLLDYAQTQQQLGLILTWLAECNPQAYNKYQPYDRKTAMMINPLQDEYLAYLIKELKDHTLRGFAPEVGGKVLSLPLAKIFLPLQAIEGRPALSEYAEQDLLRQMPHGEGASSEIDWQRQHQEMERRQAQLQARQSAQRPLNLAELLTHSRSVLLGDPGTGKTTVTRYVTYALAAHDSTHVGTAMLGRIPILVRLANYGTALDQGRVTHLLDYIEKELTPRHEFGPFLRQAIEAGQCLVILDGLDEVTNSKLRVDVTEQIQKFVAGFSPNQFMVTSRIVGYNISPLTHEFQHATLKEMETVEQARFIQLWYEAIGAEIHTQSHTAADLVEVLRLRPSIARMAANPLLLTIMVLMHWRGVRLPHRRVQIYQNTTNTLIESWTSLRSKVDLNADEVKKILAPIAHHILSSNVSGVIAQQELWPLFSQGIMEYHGYLKHRAEVIARQMLRLLGEQSGIFLERGLDHNQQPVYGFLHQTFGEYLAGLHLAHEIQSETFALEKYLHKAMWREPLLLAMGHLSIYSSPQANTMLRQILEFPALYESVLQRNLLFAVDCLIDEIQVKPNLRDEILTRLAKLLDNNYETLQYEAVKRYRELGKSYHNKEHALITLKTVWAKEIAEPNKAFTNDKYGGTQKRLHLTQVLLYLGDNLSAKPLFWSLTQDNSQAQRLRFEYWPDEAAAYLLELYQQYGLFILDDLAYCALGNISLTLAQQVLGQAELHQLLTQLLVQTTNAHTQAKLQYCLALIVGSDQLDRWLELTQSDKPSEIRRYAAFHLLNTNQCDHGVMVLQELINQGSIYANSAMRILLEAKLTPTLDWQLLQTKAFLSRGNGFSPFGGNYEAIIALFHVGRFNIALPAMWHYIATFDFGFILYFARNALPSYASLAQTCARWLALIGSLEACEWLLEIGQVENTLPLLNYLAVNTYEDDARQQACQKLLALSDIDIAASLMVHVTNSPNIRLQYQAYLTLALADRRQEEITFIPLSQLREQYYPDYFQTYCQTWHTLLTLAHQSLANLPESPSRLLGEMSLDLLAHGYSERDAGELLYYQDNLALQLQGVWFCLRTGDLTKLQPRLLKLLKQISILPNNDSNQALQLWARYLLVHTSPTQQLVQEVLTWLVTEDRSLRLLAYHVWAKLCHVLDLPNATQPLLVALQDEDWQVRNFAAIALGQQANINVIPDLTKILANQDKNTSYYAKKALQKLYRLVDQNTLIQALSHELWEVRCAAIQSLSRRTDTNNLLYLEQALNDSHEDVRIAAISLLAKYKIKVSWLQQALHDSHESIRTSAINLLANQVEALPFLEQAFNDKHKNVRAIAIKTYIQISFSINPAPLEITKLTNIVITALNDNEDVVRRVALQMLIHFDADFARPHLLKAITDNLGWIRSQALTTLSHFVTLADLSLVLPRLTDTAVYARKSAANLLGQLASTQVLSSAQQQEVQSALLVASLYNDYIYGIEDVRRDAWRALAKIGYEPDPDMLTFIRHTQGVGAIAPFLATGKVPHAKEILLAHAMLNPERLTVDKDIVVALNTLGVALPWAWLVDEAEE